MDPIVQGFKDEFKRFIGLQKKQIADCPEDVWQKKAGGYYFWQQQLHSLGCISLFVLPEGEPEPVLPFPRAVVMLSEEPQGLMTKGDMLALADRMAALANTVMSAMPDADLPKKNERMSKSLGRDCTNQSALMALVRHCCYHLGCCDSVLRDHGLPGVY